MYNDWLLCLYSNVYRLAPPKKRVLLLEYLYVYLLCPCRHFLGVNGYAFLIPMFFQGLVDMTSDIASRKAHELLRQFKHEVLGVADWELDIVPLVTDHLRKALSSNSIQHPIPGKQIQKVESNLVASLDLAVVLNSVLGCCFVLGFESVGENSSGPMHTLFSHHSRELTLLLSVLMSPSLATSSRAILLEERRYYAVMDTVLKEASLQQPPSSVAGGYYRAAWSGTREDSAKCSIRKVCSMLGQYGE